MGTFTATSPQQITLARPSSSTMKTAVAAVLLFAVASTVRCAEDLKCGQIGADVYAEAMEACTGGEDCMPKCLDAIEHAVAENDGAKIDCSDEAKFTEDYIEEVKETCMKELYKVLKESNDGSFPCEMEEVYDNDHMLHELQDDCLEPKLLVCTGAYDKYLDEGGEDHHDHDHSDHGDEEEEDDAA